MTTRDVKRALAARSESLSALARQLGWTRQDLHRRVASLRRYADGPPAWVGELAEATALSETELLDLARRP